jgi:hypothetical protein
MTDEMQAEALERIQRLKEQKARLRHALSEVLDGCRDRAGSDSVQRARQTLADIEREDLADGSGGG